MTDTQSITLVEFGSARTVPIENGQTVRDVLESNGVDSDASIRFRGETLDGQGLDVVLHPGDTVVTAPPTVDHGS